MGCMWVIGLCVGCRQIFGFNPLRVPSIVVHNTTGALTGKA